MLPIPIGTDRPQRRLPLVNLGLIAANLLIFLLSHVSTPQGPVLTPEWSRYMLFADHPTLWQFITYQFLHQNWMHVLGNMLFLYVFGNNLNEKLGHISYLLFYLAGGVLAGCGQLLVANAPTLGASGAISAVTGMYFVLLPRTNIRILLWFFFFMDVFEIPSIYFIALNVLKDIFEPWVSPGSHVAYQAHLAGTLAGFLIGLLLLLTRLVQRDHYDLGALISRQRRRKEYERLVSTGYDPFQSAPPPTPAPTVPPPPVNPQVEALREQVLRYARAHQSVPAAAGYLELRKLDPAHVLPGDAQRDVANQLMADGKHAEAAQAYEDYLRTNPFSNEQEQIQLILGLIYSRYIPQPARAVELLKKALVRLHNESQRALAQEELARLAPPDGVST